MKRTLTLTGAGLAAAGLALALVPALPAAAADPVPCARMGGTVTILIYMTVIFAEFLAPFRSAAFSSEYTYAPPQPLHIFDRTEEGLRISPYVSGYTVEVDPVALRRTFMWGCAGSSRSGNGRNRPGSVGSNRSHLRTN